jgi:hypothetical protein
LGEENTKLEMKFKDKMGMKDKDLREENTKLGMKDKDLSEENTKLGMKDKV